MVYPVMAPPVMVDPGLGSPFARAAALLTMLVAGAAVAQTSRPELNPRWFDRMSDLDRALLQQLVGYAPPAFTPELTWIGAPPPTWSDLRGKVVLLQSWTNRTTPGRNVVRRAEKLAAADGYADLRVVLVHTPEGAANLQNFLERRPVKLPVALDSSGGFCDDVGFYKDPANILVDRNGVVRLAGLNARGLDAAIGNLLAEPADPAFTPPVRGEEAGDDTSVAFPIFSVPVNDAKDFRGKPAPPFYVKDWETPEPNAAGKVVVINFWSTDSDVCVQHLRTMNDLADRYRNDVVVVGISDQSSSNFKEGRAEHRIGDSDLRHAVALDATARMKQAMEVQRIPHCVVISSDWIVRWQGNPARLEADAIARIVRADQMRKAGAQGSRGERPRRWTGG